jgi:hypothetical protein
VELDGDALCHWVCCLADDRRQTAGSVARRVVIAVSVIEMSG